MALGLFTDFITVDIAEDTLGIDKLGDSGGNLAFIVEVEMTGQHRRNLISILPDAVDKDQGFFRCIRVI